MKLKKKITDHKHGKYITTPEFKNFSAAVFTTTLARDFNTKLQDISKRITPNKPKHLLGENELKKLQKFDSSYFRGRNRFEEDGVQNYSVFQPMYKYF